VTTSNAHDRAGGDAPKRGWRRWNTGERATVLGTVFGFLALVVAILTWQLPKQTAAGSDPTGSSTGAPAPPAGKVTSSSPSTDGHPHGSEIFIAAGALPLEAGGDRVTDVPRAVRDRDDYTAHAVAVKCPSNQTGDPFSDVTYLLQGRYARFDATVHPYYPAGSDQQSATYVTVMAAQRQRDDTLTTTNAGDQKRANPGTPATLTADVEHAEKLTVRVQCGNPNGTVMLTNARLTPA